jgi:hypothetical protein
METSDNSQQFKSLEWLSSLPKSELDILFEKKTNEMCATPWFSPILSNDTFPDLPNLSLYNVSGDWKQLLPFPEPRPQRTYSGRFSQQEARWLDDERIWNEKANNWLTKKKSEIGYKIYKIKEFFRKGVPLLNSEYKIDLKEDKLIKSWFNSIKNLTLNEFLDLAISENIGPFLANEGNKARQELIPGLSIIDPAEIINSVECYNQTQEQSIPKKDNRIQKVNPTDTKKDPPKRYNNEARDRARKTFEDTVEEEIQKAFRNKKVPIKEKIIQKAYSNLIDKRKSDGSALYSERTLRNYLTSQEKKELYGIIYRKILEANNIKIR